jgi:hypothetical protein
MAEKGIGGHQRAFRGRTDDWLTPPEIIKGIGPFDLDPCCPRTMPWETAGVMLHEGIDDGLNAEWFGRVWLNPPYGPETGKWLEKMKHYGRGTALIFARTETEMFFDHIWHAATALLFLKGRLHFHGVDGKRSKFNAGGPSVLVAYGRHDADMLRRSPVYGKFVEFPLPR